ncbi:hypothetical protein Mgra_00007225 [Meloidogyne graminicola]|uniref:Uncharacterized protein n=1 Tax=Meloidogyne graminicola TaxID=189291 RepID=A0A8S9ZIX3_9BILA|nr:hypothetical protein Mgra_00007225 [Meloidogyne graminicola]
MFSTSFGSSSNYLLIIIEFVVLLFIILVNSIVFCTRHKKSQKQSKRSQQMQGLVSEAQCTNMDDTHNTVVYATINTGMGESTTTGGYSTFVGNNSKKGNITSGYTKTRSGTKETTKIDGTTTQYLLYCCC